MINLKDKKTKIILVASLFVLVAIVLVLISKFSIYPSDSSRVFPSPKPPKEINSFEECAKAGYPVTLSYPRQCRTPDGKMFIGD